MDKKTIERIDYELNDLFKNLKRKEVPYALNYVEHWRNEGYPRGDEYISKINSKFCKTKKCR
jgi:hypothetical protein